MPRPQVVFDEGITIDDLYQQLGEMTVPANTKVLAQDMTTGKTYRIITTIVEPATFDPEDKNLQLTRTAVFLRLKEET